MKDATAKLSSAFSLSDDCCDGLQVLILGRLRRTTKSILQIASSGSGTLAYNSVYAERRISFKSLESALKSGDLSGAQQAFQTLKQYAPIGDPGAANLDALGQHFRLAISLRPRKGSRPFNPIGARKGPARTPANAST